MGKSLKELVGEFSESARRRIIEQTRANKNADTKTVEFQGYSSDGKILVKDGDETRAVRETGNTSLRRGTKLTEDSASSVDSPRVKRRQDVAPAPVPVELRRSEEFRDKGTLIRQDELSGSSENEYWVSFRPTPPRHLMYYSTWHNRTVGQNAYITYVNSSYVMRNAEADVGTISTSSQTGDYRYQSDDPNEYSYHLFASAWKGYYSAVCGVYANVQFNPTGYGSSNRVKARDVGGGYLESSLPYVLNNTTYYTTIPIVRDAGFNSYLDGQYDYNRFEVFVFNIGDINTPGPFQTVTHAISDIQWKSCEVYPFYYYGTKNQSTGDQILFSIDISDYFPGQTICYCERIRNYYRKEINAQDNEYLVNYATYIVVCVENVSDYTQVGSFQGSSSNDIKGVSGRLSHYVMHTRLDLDGYTFNYNITALNPLSGNQTNMIKNTTGYFYTPTTYNFPNGAMFYSRMYNTGNTLYQNSNTLGADFGFRPFGIQYLDPTPIFSSAFAGDWLSSVPFSNTGFSAATSADWSDLLEFVGYQETGRYLLNYYTPKVIQTPLTNCGSTYLAQYEYITPSHVELANVQTIADIRTIVNNMFYVGVNGDRWDFRGPDFKEYTTMEEIGLVSLNGNTSRTRKCYAPDIGEFGQYLAQYESTSCSEEFPSDTLYGNYLGTKEFDFYDISSVYLHSVVPITSYSVENGYATINLKFYGGIYNGEEVTVTGTGVLDGTNIIITEASPTSLVFSTSLQDTAQTQISGYVAVNL